MWHANAVEQSKSVKINSGASSDVNINLNANENGNVANALVLVAISVKANVNAIGLLRPIQIWTQNRHPSHSHSRSHSLSCSHLPAAYRVLRILDFSGIYCQFLLITVICQSFSFYLLSWNAPISATLHTVKRILSGSFLKCLNHCQMAAKLNSQNRVKFSEGNSVQFSIILFYFMFLWRFCVLFTLKHCPCMATRQVS